MNTQTIFSPCRKYRYTLWRIWSSVGSLKNPPFDNELKPLGHSDFNPANGFVQFIGLNPSTADETNDDPTIRRCINFAKSWGFGGMCMTNIFAWRDTDPKGMKQAVEPVGVENRKWLAEIASNASLVVAAWGNHGEYMNHGKSIAGTVGAIKPVKCFKISKGGHPVHPLYQPSNAVLIDYPISPK